MEAKRSLPDDLITLLRQLVVNDQIRMAARVLEIFFIREWKMAEDGARYLTKRYFLMYYSDHVYKFQQRIGKV